MTSNPGDVVICRACVIECNEYKSLYKQGLIMGEVTTLASLLAFCTNLDIMEQDDTLPSFICTKCVHDLAKSFAFKKRVLEANQILNGHIVNEDVHAPDEEYTNEKTLMAEECETDLQELAEAAQMKRELEQQNYDHDEYEQLTNEDEEQLEQDNNENHQHNHHEEEDDEEMEYVVQDVAETTEIYHTTIITQEETQHIDLEEHEEIEEHDEIEEHEQEIEEHVQEIEEQEQNQEQQQQQPEVEEVEYEIHVNDMEEDYTELITDSQDGMSQQSFKRPLDDTTISESENALRKPFVKKFKRSAQTDKAPNRDFQCRVCGKQLSNASSFKYHMQLHSNETPYKCTVCGEAFKTRNAYDGHISIHDPNNPNTCELCGKSYRQPSSLRMHMLTHTGEKPFTCDVCGKSLTQKSGYKKHMLTHTGEKPYSCDICGKAFRISSNMLAHRRSHTGEKPHQCIDCDKAFNTAEQLKRHILVHSDDKPFSCNICDKQFKRQSALRSHMQSHESANGDTTYGENNRVKSNVIEEVYEPSLYEEDKPNCKSTVVEIY